MARFKSLGYVFYLASILTYFTLTVNLFKGFYFQILNRYEYQLLLLFSGPDVKIPELEALIPVHAFSDLINHYSLINFLSANLVLILIFVTMLKSKLSLQIYALSLVFLVLSIFPSYYFSRGLSEHQYINQLSSLTLGFSVISHFLLGIYIFKTLYRSETLAT